MREFFSTYYHPANASLAIAGDIDADEALDLARALLRGSADRARRWRPVRPPTPPLAGETRLLLEDRVELPRLYIGVADAGDVRATDDAELDLAADILANGKTSRLYRRLVYDERIATDVSAAQNSREIGGFLQVAATAAPGHTLAELERVIVEEIRRLADEGPTDDEIERGRVQAEAQFMFRLQTRRRVRRQVRSAERLQRVHRRSRLLRPRSRALSAGDARSRCRRAVRAVPATTTRASC